MNSAGLSEIKSGTELYMSLYPEESTDKGLRLGNIVPDFKATGSFSNRGVVMFTACAAATAFAPAIACFPATAFAPVTGFFTGCS